MSKNNIVLIGMPGCGKSSIGSLIAKKLRLDFYDLDKYIEQREGTRIPELFKHGENHFREIETNAVREICCKESVVISTGGGVVTRPENMTLLKQTGTIFYIQRPIDMILQSSDLASRPLLTKDHTKIYTLYKERKHLYEKYCDFRIYNTRSLWIAVDRIVRIVRKKNTKHRHML